MAIDLISLPEYADKVGRNTSVVRRKCIAGRIPGAVKIGRNWLIPKDAPYEDYRVTSNKYTDWRKIHRRKVPKDNTTDSE